MEDMILCQPCKKMRKAITATVYCPQCREFQCHSCIAVHNSFKALNGHTCITLKPGTSEVIYTTIGKLTHCEIHGVPIKYLCTKESKFCCTECFFDGHRYCENVIKIDGIKVKTKHILDVSQQLSDVQLNLKSDVEVFDDHALHLNDELEKIKTYFQRMKSRLCETIDEQQCQILTEARARQTTVKNAVSKQRIDSLSMLKDTEEIIDVNEALLECGTEKARTVITFKAEEIIKVYRGKSAQNKDCPIDLPRFSIKVSTELEDILSAKLTLFRLQDNSSDFRPENSETEILDQLGEDLAGIAEYYESEDYEVNDWYDENQEIAASFIDDFTHTKHVKKGKAMSRRKKQTQ